MFKHVEGLVQDWVEWLRLLVEALGAPSDRGRHRAGGVLPGARALSRQGGSFNPIRLAFARYLTLALELQLAAGILSTSVAPTWDRIGKLAAIAVIRTGLNYFLSKETEHESATQESQARRAAGAGG